MRVQLTLHRRARQLDLVLPNCMLDNIILTDLLGKV